VAEFQLAIPIVLENEGGLVDTKGDAGGLTNMGISQRSYPSLDIRNLTVAQATEIYKRDFWKYDDVIDQALANKIFDASVNMGHTAILIMQRLVFKALTPDGIWGPETCDAVNRADAGTLLTQYRAALAQHYQDIVSKNPQDAEFLDGWLRRAKQ
jgi:lysozyme family protein